MKPAYVGIDVAFAKKKRLPIVICTWRAGRLVPAPLRRLPFAPPAGLGNAAACDAHATREFAAEAVEYLLRVQETLGVRIERIGIDAPSAPRSATLLRREAESALHSKSISYYKTPSDIDFQLIRRRVDQHLDAGGVHSRLPHANQLWMQVGFALFRELQAVAECIEVYPQATAHQLGVGSIHKSKHGAVETQLAEAGRHTGWPSQRTDEPRLSDIAWGTRHDQLDAYLSSWVAALEEADRIALGMPPHDAIWIPRVTPREPDSKVDVARPIAQVPRAPQNPLPGPPTRTPRLMSCPACAKVFKDFPLGWDAHAAYRCGGLRASDPEERKREYKSTFGHLFGSAG